MDKTNIDRTLKPSEMKTVAFSIDQVCTLYFYEDRVFRAVNPEFEEEVQQMFDSGMIGELVDEKVFVKTWISDVKIEEYNLVLEHENIAHWNYPYEWSFTMLRDAAKVVLDANSIANKYDYELFDVHAYNVVFNMTTPQYVDLGSLFKRDPKNGKCWSGYLNFYNSFFMPLYLYKKGYSDLAQSMYLYNGFFSAKDFFMLRYKWLTLFGSKVTNSIFKVYDNLRRLSVARHFKVIDKFGKHKRIDTILKVKKTFQNRFSVNKGYRLLNKAKKSGFDSYWKDYHTNIEPHQEKRFQRITELINTKLIDANTLTELASNQGKFARYVLENTQIEKVIATDYDKNAVNELYRNNKDSQQFLPLLYDFVRPNGRRVDTLLETRIKGDAVMALAVTHHLILTQDVSLEHIFGVLSSLTNNYVIVEFMPLGLYFGDMDKIPPVPEYYTLDWFKTEFLNHFELICDEEVEINRHLFIGKLKK